MHNFWKSCTKLRSQLVLKLVWENFKNYAREYLESWYENYTPFRSGLSLWMMGVLRLSILPLPTLLLLSKIPEQLAIWHCKWHEGTENCLSAFNLCLFLTLVKVCFFLNGMDWNHWVKSNDKGGFMFNVQISTSTNPDLIQSLWAGIYYFMSPPFDVNGSMARFFYDLPNFVPTLFTVL